MNCKTVFSIFLLSIIVSRASAQSKNFIDQPYIEVNGSFDTLVTPDEIFIRIVISERDTRDRESVEDLERDMFNALKKVGIDVDKNLTTSNMGSDFKSYIFKGKEVVKSKSYLLKVPDAVIATKVFIELEELDISNVSIDHVSRSDIRSLENIVRAKAIVDARSRATTLTAAIDQQVGPAIHINENDLEISTRRNLTTMSEVVVVGYSASGVDKKREFPKIEFEKIKVSNQVAVKFLLKS